MYGQTVPAIYIASQTRGSAHSVDTAATFIPIEYNDLDNFNRSQFSSTTVIPDEIPRIWVCTAPATAVLHTSELFITTLGEFAVGGALSVTTVDDTVVFVSAAARLVDKKTTIKVIAAKFKNVFINYLILV
jgi:hypothetical protein